MKGRLKPTLVLVGPGGGGGRARLPGWTAFATACGGETLAGKVEQALPKLKPGSPEALSVLERASLDGFAPTADKDFGRIRGAARLAGAY
jgi:hypothetical protein